MESIQCSICGRSFTRKNNRDPHFRKCEQENQELLSSQNRTSSASTAQIGGPSAFSPPRTPTVTSSSSPQKVLSQASLECSPQKHRNLKARMEDTPYSNIYRYQGSSQRAFEKNQVSRRYWVGPLTNRWTTGEDSDTLHFGWPNDTCDERCG